MTLNVIRGVVITLRRLSIVKPKTSGSGGIGTATLTSTTGMWTFTLNAPVWNVLIVTSRFSGIPPPSVPCTVKGSTDRPVMLPVMGSLRMPLAPRVSGMGGMFRV
ncbi:hypothetical protein H7J74_14595 [Mycobacterium angelicum]|nr:hypothetical protein [Mycobacterium angelicum]